MLRWSREPQIPFYRKDDFSKWNLPHSANNESIVTESILTTVSQLIRKVCTYAGALDCFHFVNSLQLLSVNVLASYLRDYVNLWSCAMTAELVTRQRVNKRQNIQLWGINKLTRVPVFKNLFIYNQREDIIGNICWNYTAFSLPMDHNRLHTWHNRIYLP